MEKQLRNCCNLSTLQRNQYFGDSKVPKTLVDIQRFLENERMTEITLEELNEWKNRMVRDGAVLADLLNPYMLGIYYINRLTSVSWDNGAVAIRFENSNIGMVSVKCKATSLQLKWERQKLCNEPLSGVLFVADRVSVRTDFFKVLVDTLGASLLGLEVTSTTITNRCKKGAARLVAENIILFSLNDGKDENAQVAAEANNLFTVTLRLDSNGSLCTISTRSFSDIKFINTSSAISDKCRRNAKELSAWETEEAERHREIEHGIFTDKPYIILVLLGLRDYETDAVLYKLAQFMTEHNYTVCPVLVFDIRALKTASGGFHFCNHLQWVACIKDHINEDNCHRNSEIERASAVDMKMKCYYAQARRALTRSRDWTILIGPVMEPAFDPVDESTMPPGKYVYKTLKTPMQVYNDVLHAKNWERVTIPLKDVHDGHGIQITTQRIETPELFRISEQISQDYLPALNL